MYACVLGASPGSNAGSQGGANPLTAVPKSQTLDPEPTTLSPKQLPSSLSPGGDGGSQGGAAEAHGCQALQLALQALGQAKVCNLDHIAPAALLVVCSRRGGKCGLSVPYT